MELERVNTLREKAIKELSPEKLSRTIKQDSLLKNYCSSKVRFIAYVHDKGGAGTSTISSNSAVLLAQNNNDVYLLDINPQNPSQNEMTREIRLDKFAIAYNYAVNLENLDENRLSKDDVILVDSPDKIDLNDRRISRILITDEMYGKNQDIVRKITAKDITLYAVREKGENGKRFFTAGKLWRNDDGNIEYATRETIEEVISIIAPKTKKVTNLLKTDLTALKKDDSLLADYFTATLIPGLHVLPTESNTAIEKNSKQLVSRVNLLHEKLKQAVQKEFIENVDYSKLIKKITGNENTQANMQATGKEIEQEIKQAISEYISEKIQSLEEKGEIKNKIMIADTSTNNKVVLDAVNMFEPIIVVPPEKTAIKEVRGLVLKLKHSRFEKILSDYFKGKIYEGKRHAFFEKSCKDYEDIELSNQAKNELKEVIERYLLPAGEKRKIKNIPEFKKEIDVVFERAGFEELCDLVEESKPESAAKKDILSLLDMTIIGEKDVYNFLREAKRINKRELYRYSTTSRGYNEDTHEQMRKTARFAENRIKKAINSIDAKTEDIDEDEFYGSLEKTLNRQLFEDIKKFEGKKEKNKHETIDFLEHLAKLGYSKEITKILDNIFTHAEKPEGTTSSGKSFSIGRKEYVIVDNDAKKTIDELKKTCNLTGIEHVFGLIDKYRPDSRKESISKEKLIQKLEELGEEFKTPASDIFKKYQNEADFLKSVLDYKNGISILLSSFSRKNSDLIDSAIEEFNKIKDCEIRNVGLIEYDDFVKNSMINTLTPFLLLDKNFKLCLDENKKLVSDYGSKTGAADDLRKVIRNIIGRGRVWN